MQGLETTPIQAVESTQPVLLEKWKTMTLLALATLLAMGTWFSASAVSPALSATWGLGEAGRAWLTMSVQAGFFIGALGSALLNLADRIPARRLFTISALAAALSTGLIAAFVNSIGPALVLRFITGACMAGVYPVGMKIMATWTRTDRGLGIGLLVGAIAVGSASPHLLNALGGAQDWRPVLYMAAGFSALGGLIAFVFVKDGPYFFPTPPFNWKYTLEIFRVRELRLANLGYLGHMWELFAMWAWLSAFLLASFQRSQTGLVWASLGAFTAISAGGVSSLLAGKLADRWGRTAISIASLALSGICALLVGALFGGSPVLLLAVCVVWGFAIVPDSAQFSAAISELCEREYTGTALTVQTSLGFLLTLVTIRLIPTLEGWLGWQWAFAFLALGPLVGIWAMLSLRRLPEAVKMAGGNR